MTIAFSIKLLRKQAYVRLRDARSATPILLINENQYFVISVPNGDAKTVSVIANAFIPLIITPAEKGIRSVATVTQSFSFCSSVM